MDGQSAGKIIINSPDNYPMLVEYPAKTQEQNIAEAEGVKKTLLRQAVDYINGMQWSGKAAIGRLTGDGLLHYGNWLDYMDALEAIDTSNAPNITWPSPPE